MSTRLGAGLLLAALLAAGPAAAAERMFQDLATKVCGAALATSGRGVELKAPLDEPTRTGLLAAVHLTLKEPAQRGWPHADMKAARECPVARFAANDRVWTIYAGDGAAPLRVITSPGREDAFVLLKGPTIGEAATWYGARQGPLPAESAYYLFAKLSEMYYLIKAYDGPPAMESIAEDIGALMEEEAVTLAFYGAGGGTVNLNLATAHGPQAELFTPENLRDGLFAALYRPDGHFAVENEQGDLVLRGSGFRCRPTYGKAKRVRVNISNPSEASLDMSCSLETDGSLSTVFVTRAPDASQDKAIFQARIKEVEAETGVHRKLTNPPTGRNSPIRAGRNWIDKEGQVQVVLLTRDGDYVYEFRQTHTLEDIEAATEVLLALVDQISAPERESAAGPQRAR
jgi:hypothetical protein